MAVKWLRADRAQQVCALPVVADHLQEASASNRDV
jgi:hypothetical protein